MTERDVPDPPEDAPAPLDEDEDILRERVEDVRGFRPTDEELAALQRETGGPEA